MAVPGYPKVMAFGTNGTEEALNGRVRIDEKIDGSQFGFGIEDGDLVFRSHGAQIYLENCPSMFKSAVDHIISKHDALGDMYDSGNAYFYAECVAKPKHNVLTYGNVPSGYMVLFDGRIGFDGLPASGKWVETSELALIAKELGILFVPPLYEGEISKADLLTLFDDLDKRESALGGTVPEGIVIKNYSKYMNIGGHIWPIMVKMVRAQFKEKHAKDWNVGGPSPLESLIASFKGDEARWTKAIMHLTEQGEIEGSPRDIGKLCAYVSKDVAGEEKEAIKEQLWRLYGRDFSRAVTVGLPEWYKARLAGGAG